MAGRRSAGAFVAEIPTGLAASDLGVIQGWRHRRAGPVFALRHLWRYLGRVAAFAEGYLGVWP